MTPRIAPRSLFAFLMMGFIFTACSKKDQSFEAAEAQPVRPGARYYYDLGPASVDASGYPKEHQQAYQLFSTACGACHTLARPLNSPYTTRSDWNRFVSRMHIKMEARGIHLSPSDEDRITRFLVYDSKVRKIENAEQFLKDQEELKNRFGQLKE